MNPGTFRAIALLGATALACSRGVEAAPPPATPPAAATTPPPGGRAEVAAPGPGATAATPAYAGGRPVAWWSERLRKLRREGPPELYRLTLERARLNGLAVVEREDGDVAVASPVPPGSRP